MLPIVPKESLKALIASTEPGAPVVHVPVHRMTRAVKVHTMMVSKNTSNSPKQPCLTGSSTLAWA